MNKFSNIIKDQFPESEIKRFLIIFYTVGFAGFLIPFSRSFFIQLIPFALILNFILTAAYHRGKIKSSEIIVFSLIYIVGLGAETAGVQTQMVFGHYTYGSGLGIKVYGTPLLIGLNWLFLVYCTYESARRLNLKGFFRILAASVFMLIYDLILEQAAPDLNMWQWENQSIPLQNYIAWFVLAFIFNMLMFFFKVNTKNKVAVLILLIQAAFFAALFFAFRFFI